jgi:hypothetical protein
MWLKFGYYPVTKSYRPTLLRSKSPKRRTQTSCVAIRRQQVADNMQVEKRLTTVATLPRREPGTLEV